MVSEKKRYGHTHARTDATTKVSNDCWSRDQNFHFRNFKIFLSSEERMVIRTKGGFLKFLKFMTPLSPHLEKFLNSKNFAFFSKKKNLIFYFFNLNMVSKVEVDICFLLFSYWLDFDQKFHMEYLR